MAWEHWFRRLVHICTPILLVYYFLPSPLWEDGPDKGLALIFILATVLFFEAIRRIVRFSLPILCLRPYERWRMAAYCWAAIGLTMTFLLFPFEVAVPAVIGMAWVDPLIGELRDNESELYPSVPMAFYFSISLISLTLLVGLSVGVFVAAILTAPLAIWVEKQRWWRLDDDFTMMVIPAFALAIVLSLFAIV